MIERVTRAARERALASCVMTFEPHPREFFAPDQAPTRLTSLREKLELFAGLDLGAVLVSRFDYDFARVGAEEFVERILVRGLAVRWLLVGDDFRFGARRAGDFDLLARAGREQGFEVARMDTCVVDSVRVSIRRCGSGWRPETSRMPRACSGGRTASAGGSCAATASASSSASRPPTCGSSTTARR
jgi:riboflavin kinase/FMN adenylyltransferase